MPFVERDFTRKICGIYTNPQHHSDGSLRTEELPDDHPEVVLFRARTSDAPKISEMLRSAPLKVEDFAKYEREIEELRIRLVRHHTAWGDLETALSALFYTILNVEPKKSRVAYAVYYSMTGFDARKNAVSNAMIQIMDESKDKELDVMREPWKKIDSKLGKARDKRNTIAHGTIQILHYMQDGKAEKHALLSPLPFDVIRISRRIQNGERPGINLNEMEVIIVRLMHLTEVVDSVIRVIEGHRQAGKETFAKTLPGLEANLRALGNPSKDDPTPAAPSGQPSPSPG